MLLLFDMFVPGASAGLCGFATLGSSAVWVLVVCLLDFTLNRHFMLCVWVSAQGCARPAPRFAARAAARSSSSATATVDAPSTGLAPRLGPSRPRNRSALQVEQSQAVLFTRYCCNWWCVSYWSLAGRLCLFCFRCCCLLIAVVCCLLAVVHWPACCFVCPLSSVSWL